jgi:hypothetical protein
MGKAGAVMNSSTNALFADGTIKLFSVVRLNECLVTTVGKNNYKVRHFINAYYRHFWTKVAVLSFPIGIAVHRRHDQTVLRCPAQRMLGYHGRQKQY